MNLVTLVQRSAIAGLGLLCLTAIDTPSAKAIDAVNTLPSVYTQADPALAGLTAYEEGVALEKEETAESLLAAIEKYKEAIALFKSAELLEQEAAVLHTLGHAYAKAEALEEAVETFKTALSMWQTIGERETILALQEDVTFSTLGWGMALENAGSVESAIAQYESALALVEGDENREHRAWLWQQKGHAYQKLEDLEQAAVSFQTSLELWQTIGSAEDEQRLRDLTIGTMYNLGISIQREGSQASLQKALEIYNKALPMFEGEELPNLRGRLLHVMGHAYEDLGDRSAALDFYEQALAIWQSVGDSEQEAALLEDIERI